jgi:hypothetical protein
MRKLYFLLACFVFLLASCVQTAPSAPETKEEVLEPQRLNLRSPLGTNLASVSPFNNSYPFIDAFKTSREWTAYAGSTVVDVDASGNVRSVKAGQGLFTQVFNTVNGAYPGGDYILLYDGEGDLSVGDDAVAIGTPTLSGNTTRQIVRVTPRKDNPATATREDNGIALGLTTTNPSNYVRNIRLIMPGGTCTYNAFKYVTSSSGCTGTSGSYAPFEQVYQSRVFHPIFLQSLSNYSTLRFMTWQETNGSIQTIWSGRPKVSDARWSTKKGVPLEIMIKLVNYLNVDAWFNMPHAADNTYVTEFAKLAKASLEPERKVYLEYSNELWLDRRTTFTDPPNSESTQFDYVVARGASLVSASECNSANAVPGSQGTGCKILKQQRYQVKRSLELFSIWQQNFGSSNLVRVIASTTLNTRINNNNTEALLSYQNAYQKIDALALAPYFGDFYYGTEVFNTLEPYLNNPTAYFNDRLEGILLQDMRNDLTKQQSIIAKYNLKLPQSRKKIALVAYEGGQILSIENGDLFNPRVAKFFTDLNRNPRMKQTYLKYLGVWKEAGGQLYNHFLHSGSWSEGQSYGSLEYLTQPRSQAPKFDALQTFIEQNPRWW